MKKINPIKVLVVFGTRPEAIKLAPVIKKFLENGDQFSTLVLSTGQHRELLEPMIRVFNINVDYDLDVMSHAQSLAQSSARILEKMGNVIEAAKPDVVLVQGDTTTTAMGALSAYYQKVPLGHVEAGLRTGDKYRPFPEEVNRKIASSIADLHFAPTPAARDNLLKENVPSDHVFVTGNTIVDALLMCIDDDHQFEDPRLNEIVARNQKIIVVTTHRRENFGEPLQNIIEAILEAAERHPSFEFVMPVHLNPNVQKIVHQFLNNHPRIHLTESLDYKSFINLLRRSSLILTDSGGIQEEAPTLRKKALILREVTERPEGLSSGYLELVGWRKQNILRAIDSSLKSLRHDSELNVTANPYGDGAASDRIKNSLLYYFNRINNRPDDFEPIIAARQLLL